MQQVDTFIHARWIIPVEPEGMILDHHSIAVRDGRIVELLPTSQAHDRYTATTEVNLATHALIPGLINAHTHTPMSLMRGLADDLPLMTWLNEHIWPAEARWVDAAFVRDGSRLAIAEMLRGGTTCFNDMYFFPEETARAADHAGIRAVVGMIVIDFPTAWARNADEYLHKGLELHDLMRDHPLVRTAFAPHAPYTVSDAPLAKLRMYADELDLPIHMHLHETADEVQQSLEACGKRPLARLTELGLLSPRLTAVHMTQLDEAEIAAVAAAGSHVVHCPESNMKLASGFCPAARLDAAGINVALGTDGAASNNDLDMFGEMRSAALLGKAVAADASALPAQRALSMATLNGARALGIDAITGSLLPGKAADVVAVDLGPLETQPMFHPISHLVYACGRHQVSDVWIAGRRLLKERMLTSLDEEEILARAAEWQQRIAASDAHPNEGEAS